MDLGVGGISHVEMSFGLGRGWFLRKHPRYLRPGRPISVSAVPSGPGIDIWRSCRFIGAWMRSLCLLPGGLRRFVPCSIGANHCRLRHIGWEKCGHGLTSRPRESASELFLNGLLGLFRYPPGLVVHRLLALFRFGILLLALLAGLPLGGCRNLVTLLVWLLLLLVLQGRLLLIVLLMRFLGLVVLVRDGREFDKTEKTSTPCGFYGSISSTCLEEVASFEAFQFFSS